MNQETLAQFGDRALTVTVIGHELGPRVRLQAAGWQGVWPEVPLAQLEVWDSRMPRIEAVAKLETVAVEPLEQGLHLTLIDRPRELGFGLWLRVRDGELHVLVPPAEVREEFDALYRVAAVNLLPGLMDAGPDGQLLLPLNTGLVVRPAGKPALRERFLIYGEQERWELLPQLPVLAAGDGRGSLVCTAVQGAADMRGEAATHGDGRGHVGLAAVWRETWHDPVDLGQRELVYTPLAAGADLLHGTAQRLRRHVLEDLGKPTLAQRIAESPEVAYLARSPISKLFFGVQRQGAMVGDRRKAAIGEPLFTPAMTFAQAQAGLARLRAAGVERLVTQSVGWNFRGHDGLYPTRFPIDERLGGEAGFRGLLRAGQDLGYRMSVHDNYLDAYLDSPDLDPELLVHDQAGQVRITGYWGGGLKGSYWGTAVPAEFIRGNLGALRELGVDGPIYLDAMGSPLLRNYHPRHRGPRAAFADGQVRFLREAQALFGGACTENGYLYALLAADSTCGAGSEFQVKRFLPEWPITVMAGERVPLWYLVMHGLLVIESHGETWADTMRGALLGLTPRIEWAMRPGVMPVLDDNLIARFKAKADVCLGRLGHLVPQPLQSWQRLADGVEQTTFGDGTEVLADYNAGRLLVNGEACPCPAPLAAAAAAH